MVFIWKITIAIYLDCYEGHYLYFEPWQHKVFSGAIWYLHWKARNFLPQPLSERFVIWALFVLFTVT